MKSRSHVIGNLNYGIALKFNRHISSTAAEVPVKFQSNRTILNTNLTASRLCEIWRWDVLSVIETGPQCLGSSLGCLLFYTISMSCSIVTDIISLWDNNAISNIRYGWILSFLTSASSLNHPVSLTLKMWQDFPICCHQSWFMSSAQWKCIRIH